MSGYKCWGCGWRGPATMDCACPNCGSSDHIDDDRESEVATLRAEVERLTRERDEAREAWATADRFHAAAIERSERLAEALRKIRLDLVGAATAFARGTALPQMVVTPGGQFLNAVLAAADGARAALATDAPGCAETPRTCVTCGQDYATREGTAGPQCNSCWRSTP